MNNSNLDRNHDFLWKSDLPGFLQVYFSGFLAMSLHEAYSDGDVLKSHLHPSITYMKKLGVSHQFCSYSTLDNFFRNYNSFFSSFFCFGQKIPHALEKSLWWTLFNNTESPLKANSCIKYIGNNGECYGDTYLGFNVHRNKNSNIPRYKVDDVKWTGWKLSGECLSKYGRFIRMNSN